MCTKWCLFFSNFYISSSCDVHSCIIFLVSFNYLKYKMKPTVYKIHYCVPHISLGFQDPHLSLYATTSVKYQWSSICPCKDKSSANHHHPCTCKNCSFTGSHTDTPTDCQTGQFYTVLLREKEHLMVQTLWYLKSSNTYRHPNGNS